MSKYRRWAVLASVAALTSSCQLELEGRACSGASAGESACMEGWACCSDEICRRDCSESDEPGTSPAGAAMSTGPAMSNASDTSSEMSPDMNAALDTSAASSLGMGMGPMAEMSPDGTEPPPSSIRVDIGPEGGELALGDASVQILPLALAATTSLELSTIELPMTLPRAREQTSRVYSLAPAQTRFAVPAIFDVPVAASQFQHMMVLELGDEGWQPVLGARFNPDPAIDPLYESPTGTVSWSSDHGGIFVVVVANHISSMDLVLDETPYRYDCDVGSSSLSAVGDNGGMGPSFSTQNSSANNPRCPWPMSEPGLWLDVLFRNFLPSEGLPLGTWDLAAPESILPLRVRFIASVEQELPVGQERPYQYYDSTAAIEGAEGPIPDVVYQGFYQSPLASGSISVTRLPTVENTGYSSDADYLGSDASLYSIELSNVTLGASDEAIPNPEEPFPPAVTITSATLTYTF